MNIWEWETTCSNHAHDYATYTYEMWYRLLNAVWMLMLLQWQQIDMLGPAQFSSAWDSHSIIWLSSSYYSIYTTIIITITIFIIIGSAMIILFSVLLFGCGLAIEIVLLLLLLLLLRLHDSDGALFHFYLFHLEAGS